MATIYTPLGTSIEPLVARIYADGVDIHNARLESGEFTPPHPLRACTSFQWYHDDLAGTVTTLGTADTHTVDVTAVTNSGEYYCDVQVGEDDDCLRRTDRRRVAIIDCNPGGINPSTFEFANDGTTTRTLAVDFPHFEQDRVSITSPTWITHTDAICAVTTTECQEQSTLTASANPMNFARNGYVDITIGDFLCSYPVQQQFANAAPVPPADIPAEAADPPLGPIVTSFVGGEAVIDSVIIVTASALVQTSTGTDTTVVWEESDWSVTGDLANNDISFITVAGSGTSAVNVALDTSTLGPKTITFEATKNGVTASNSSSYTIVADQSAITPGVISGEITGRATARTLAFGGPRDAPRLDPAQNSFTNTFMVNEGTATIRLIFSDDGSFFSRFPYIGDATFTYQISGPGIRNGSQGGTINLAADAADIVLTNEDFVDTSLQADQFLIPGEYTITSTITNPGGRNNNRFWNIHYSPTVSYFASANFPANFFDFFNFNF